MTRVMPLGEVAVIERTVRAPDRIEAGTPYVGLENIETGGNIVGVRQVDAGELASAKFDFTDRHVLFGKLRPYLAKIALPSFAGVCSTDIVPILPGDDIDRHYLCWFLRQPAVVDLAASRSVGANLPRLNPAELAQFFVPVPPIEEQRRIAAVLNRADELRAKRWAAIRLLHSLRESIFLDMFGDPLGNPKGWQLVRLADVSLEIQIGPFGSLLHKSDYVEGGVPVVNPMHIVDDGILRDSRHAVGPEKAAVLSRYVLTEGDIVMARRGEMGRCAIVDAASAGMLCGSGSLFIRPDESQIDVRYLHEVLTSVGMKGHLERKALGVTMANLNGRIVGDLPIPLPALDVQKRFASATALVDDQRERLTSGLQSLDGLFSSLQHRAFAGIL